MEGIELISFQIISAVGAARSCYIEAIQLAKNKEFDLATGKIKEGDQLFNEGHHAHGSLIQKEAAGEKTEFSIILMHAEDQLMSAEGFRIISEEFVELYKSLN
ncbi:PTS lactose/cellobiose transporter subunit IIA [Enterococcus raffinosus]|uniref:PTS lactose/cellobiose transporter subunit IIA n=1 Tax=Enterococcus raffinosus TaxID=71452 RepID=UPI001C1092EC|nr:PTS lactose/cellobiose transporter subunit IIA [Enterococcus raffinosus]MBU5362185.1 PTS lactose/cellobiose transporter subunit IIA [Enterococcus raffinosus]